MRDLSDSRGSNRARQLKATRLLTGEVADNLQITSQMTGSRQSFTLARDLWCIPQAPLPWSSGRFPRPIRKSQGRQPFRRYGCCVGTKPRHPDRKIAWKGHKERG
jgi:hypothetical protein